MDKPQTVESRMCPGGCNKSVPSDDFAWTQDRYGNPWKKVCGECFERVQAEIAKWKFDAGDAGEALEPEDY